MRPSWRLGPLVLLALLAACASSDPGGGPARDIWLERRVMLMGTSLDLAIAAVDRERALEASERAVAALEAAEARLSTWREDSELARLNRAPAGRPQPLSPALAADLGAARRCWEETKGAFDPAIAPLVAAWGLREGGRLPSETERREALAASGMAGLRLELIESGRAAVRERPDLAIEEGGFGKGAGLADAVAALTEVPGVAGAVLDFGGQVAVLGTREEGDWKVEVADPRRRDLPVVALSIPSGSVSTSGNSERGITVEGRRLGHLLDPRTGEPAPDFGSVTVWTADPLRADCLSTGLYVMGPEAALAWAAGHPGVEVLVLQPSGDGLEALATQGLRGRIEPLTREVHLVFAG